jgi:hypothetical protein
MQCIWPRAILRMLTHHGGWEVCSGRTLQPGHNEERPRRVSWLSWASRKASWKEQQVETVPRLWKIEMFSELFHEGHRCATCRHQHCHHSLIHLIICVLNADCMPSLLPDTGIELFYTMLANILTQAENHPYPDDSKQ